MDFDFIPLDQIKSLESDAPIFPPQGQNDGIFSTFGKSLVHGFLNVAGGLVGTAEEAIELIPGVEETNYLTGIRSNILAEQKNWETTPDNIVKKGAQILGGALPYMGAALAGGMYLGSAGAAGVAFAVEGQDAYDAAKARGATETQANLERGIVGTINAAIEALQIGKVLKFSSETGFTLRAFKEAVRKKAYSQMATLGGKFTRDVLKNSIEEAVEEALQQGVSIAAPYVVEGRQALPLRPDGSIDTWEILSEVGQAALAGAVVSPFLGVAKVFLPTMVAPDASRFAAMRQSILNTTGKSNEWKAARLYDLDRQYEQMTERLPDLQTTETAATEQPLPTPIATYQTYLQDLAITAKEVAEARPLHEQEISARRAAKLHDADEWAKENAHLVEEGVLSRDEFGATYASILTGRLTPEFDFTLTQGMDAAIKDAIRHTIPTDSFQFIEAQSAWIKLSRDKVLPERSEIKALEPVIGTDLVNTFLGIQEKHYKSRRSAISRLVDNFSEIANFPRAMVASLDLSFVGLQGLKTTIRYPMKGLKAIAAGWRAFLNPANLQFQELLHKTHPAFTHVTNVMKVKYYSADGRDTDERFVSKLAGKIPGIKASERGWVAAANELRMGLALKMYEQYKHSNLSKQQWHELGQAINHLTGYGDAKSLSKLMPILNFAFFSPRSNLANIQIFTDLHPWQLVRDRGAANPARRLVAGTLVADVAFSVGLLYLMSLIKGVEVEVSPFSSDFGKIKIGDTRFEFFGNEHRMARLVAQMIHGKRKTQAGKLTEADRVDIITRYLQSKSSPSVGLIVDYLKGQDYLGRPLGDTPDEIMTQVYSRFTPLFLQDMADYIASNGLDMDIAITAPLAFHGISTLTYPMSKASQSVAYKDQKAREFFNKDWDDLGPAAQKALRAVEPNIVELELLAKKEREDNSINVRFLREQRKTEKRLKNSFSKDVREELDRLLVDVGGFNRRIGDGWVLNDQRFAEYQLEVSKLLNVSLPKLIRLNMNPLYKRMLIEDHIDNVKQLIRRKIIYTANVKDFARV